MMRIRSSPSAFSSSDWPKRQVGVVDAGLMAVGGDDLVPGGGGLDAEHLVGVELVGAPRLAALWLVGGRA